MPRRNRSNLRVLCVESDSADADRIRKALATARAHLAKPGLFDLVLVDLRVAGGHGLELLPEIRSESPGTAVVVLTGQGDEHSAVAALKGGADDYLVKAPGDLVGLAKALETAVADRRARKEHDSQPIRLLYAEHHEADVELTRRHLRAHAPNVRMEVVTSAEEVLRRLLAREGDRGYDAVLLDYSLPGKNALDVLKVLRSEGGLEVPIVLVTGQGDEENAVQALRLGAVDYLVKDANYLLRLPSVLDSAVHRFRLERQQSALAASEERYRDLVENSGDLICTHDLEGRMLSANATAVRLMGFPREFILRSNLTDLVAPSRRDGVRDYLRHIGEVGEADGVLTLQTSAGQDLIVEYRNTLRTEGVPFPFVRGSARDITDRWRAERALARSERRLAGIIDSAMDAVISVDDESRIVLFNPAAEEIFGCRREEALGQSIDRFIPERFRDQHRDHVSNYITTGETARTRGHLGVVQGLRASGEEFPVEASLSRIEIGGSGLSTVILRDVSDRLRAEEGLQTATKQLELAVTSGGVGLWDWRIDDGSVVLTSEWKRQIGYGPEEIPDDIEEWRKRVHPDDWERVLDEVNRCRADPSLEYRVQYRLQHKDGSYRHMLATGSVITDVKGRAVRMMGSHVDLTDRVELEMQLRHAQRMETVGRLAGGVAHDFNNLLTVISGYAEMAALELHAQDPMQEMLASIQEAGERAAGLTGRLLAFSRKQVVQPVVLDLNKSVRDLRPMLERVVGADVELRFDLCDEPLVVEVDRGQIEQVVMNLIVNARDAMPEGGRLVIATSKRPATPAGEHPDVMVLEVQDTGSGMDPATQDHIFEPFFTTKPEGKGTGLGLATVYGIVHQSGGRISVESQIGVGSTFTVTLPTVEAQRATIAAARVSGDQRGSETILLVEDEVTVRELTCRILEGAGYQVLMAANGLEALAHLESFSGPIDLMITDLVMPEMSGHTLTEHLRSIRPDVKIMMMSGHSERAVEPRLKGQLGAPFLVKPFTVAGLRSKVREVLEGRSGPRAASKRSEA